MFASDGLCVFCLLWGWFSKLVWEVRKGICSFLRGLHVNVDLNNIEKPVSKGVQTPWALQERAIRKG